MKPGNGQLVNKISSQFLIIGPCLRTGPFTLSTDKSTVKYYHVTLLLSFFQGTPSNFPLQSSQTHVLHISLISHLFYPPPSAPSRELYPTPSNYPRFSRTCSTNSRRAGVLRNSRIPRPPTCIHTYTSTFGTMPARIPRGIPDRMNEDHPHGLIFRYLARKTRLQPLPLNPTYSTDPTTNVT